MSLLHKINSWYINKYYFINNKSTFTCIVHKLYMMESMIEILSHIKNNSMNHEYYKYYQAIWNVEFYSMSKINWPMENVQNFDANCVLV
jgi:capsule polysaccharide export protein KpsE/RkpR